MANSDSPATHVKSVVLEQHGCTGDRLAAAHDKEGCFIPHDGLVLARSAGFRRNLDWMCLSEAVPFPPRFR
jgi:hypothetical protein